jgi:ribosome-associated translation inhibitor RaiA
MPPIESRFLRESEVDLNENPPGGTKMNFELRTHQVDLVNALRAYAERLLQSKLGPHAEHVRKLKLRLTQHDSANCDAPKLCFLAAELVPSGELIVMETSRDLFMAVSRAIERFKTALRRKVERQRSTRRSRESVKNPIS